jgi:hypothetical protein
MVDLCTCSWYMPRSRIAALTRVFRHNRRYSHANHFFRNVRTAMIRALGQRSRLAF